jgi:cyanophycin synthetase
MNVVDLLLQQASSRPEALAVRHRDEVLGYGALGRRVSSVAAALASAGVVRGDVLALCLDDPLDHLLASLAAAHRGATVVSVPRSMPEALRARLLALTRAGRALADDGNRGGADIGGLPVLAWSALDKDGPSPTLEPAGEVADQPWIYVTGSGSTGRPKILPVTHRQQCLRSRLGPSWLPYGAQDVLCSMVSMHFYSAKQRCLEAMVLGAGIFLDTPGRVDLRREVAEGEVTVIHAMVSHIETLLRRLPAQESGAFARLQALMLGGSTVSMALRDEIRRRLTPRVHVFFGTNESHTATLTRLDEVHETSGGVGRPFPGVRIEVVDEAGQRMPAGVDGLVRIASPMVIDGYLGDDEATGKAFAKGWFYPGDIGHLTADGQLVHRGRADDMMIVGGVNLHPAEIEQCLRRHRGVRDALARPLRHRVLQDVPVALVVPEAGALPGTHELVAHVQAQLGRHALHDVILVDRIPRSELGKVQRDAIEAILERHYSARDGGRAGGARGPLSRPRQLQTRFELEFAPPIAPVPARMDAWIALLGEDALFGTRPSDGREAADPLRYWLQQVLRLARLFLQLVRVPVFDVFHLIDCAPADEHRQRWRAAFLCPGPEFVSRTECAELVGIAFRIARLAQDTDPGNAQDRERLFLAIGGELLQPYGKRMPAGKSTLEVLRAAYRLDIPFRPLGGGVYQLGWGSRARRIERSTTDGDSVFGMRWSHDKWMASELLRAAGLPAPTNRLAETVEEARAAAHDLGYPVVVKPVDRDRGEGVTVDVGDDEGLARAFATAHERSPGKRVLVERQAPGVCHRIFVAAGRLLYAVRRLPAGVYGDGRASISALVEAEYVRQMGLPPWRRTPGCPLDDIALEMLARQDLGPEDVPAAGRFVALRRIETTASGGVDEEVTHALHPENVRAAIAAARFFGLEVAGVDMISPDITAPWHANGAIINEVNFAPLLGGGEISRRYVDEYLVRLVDGRGRIPVEVFVGGAAAWEAAEARWRARLQAGVVAFLCNDVRTLGGDGQPFALPVDGLHARVRALTLRAEVGALVLVVQTLELLGTGLPLDRVDRVVVVDGKLGVPGAPALQAADAEVVGLIALCRAWSAGGAAR